MLNVSTIASTLDLQEQRHRLIWETFNFNFFTYWFCLHVRHNAVLLLFFCFFKLGLKLNSQTLIYEL